MYFLKYIRDMEKTNWEHVLPNLLTKVWKFLRGLLFSALSNLCKYVYDVLESITLFLVHYEAIVLNMSADFFK